MSLQVDLHSNALLCDFGQPFWANVTSVDKCEPSVTGCGKGVNKAGSSIRLCANSTKDAIGSIASTVEGNGTKVAADLLFVDSACSVPVASLGLYTMDQCLFLGNNTWIAWQFADDGVVVNQQMFRDALCSARTGNLTAFPVGRCQAPGVVGIGGSLQYFRKVDVVQFESLVGMLDRVGSVVSTTAVATQPTPPISASEELKSSSTFIGLVVGLVIALLALIGIGFYVFFARFSSTAFENSSEPGVVNKHNRLNQSWKSANVSGYNSSVEALAESPSVAHENSVSTVTSSSVPVYRQPQRDITLFLRNMARRFSSRDDSVQRAPTNESSELPFVQKRPSAHEFTHDFEENKSPRSSTQAKQIVPREVPIPLRSTSGKSVRFESGPLFPKPQQSSLSTSSQKSGSPILSSSVSFTAEPEPYIGQSSEKQNLSGKVDLLQLGSDVNRIASNGTVNSSPQPVRDGIIYQTTSTFDTPEMNSSGYPQNENVGPEITVRLPTDENGIVVNLDSTRNATFIPENGNLNAGPRESPLPGVEEPGPIPLKTESERNVFVGTGEVEITRRGTGRGRTLALKNDSARNAPVVGATTPREVVIDGLSVPLKDDSARQGPRGIVVQGVSVPFKNESVAQVGAPSRGQSVPISEHDLPHYLNVLSTKPNVPTPVSSRESSPSKSVGTRVSEPPQYPDVSNVADGRIPEPLAISNSRLEAPALPLKRDHQSPIQYVEDHDVYGLSQNVRAWVVEEVARWVVTGAGMDDRTASNVTKHKINGRILMEASVDDIVNAAQIDILGDRFAFKVAVTELRERYNRYVAERSIPL